MSGEEDGRKTVKKVANNSSNTFVSCRDISSEDTDLSGSLLRSIVKDICICDDKT